MYMQSLMEYAYYIITYTFYMNYVEQNVNL